MAFQLHESTDEDNDLSMYYSATEDTSIGETVNKSNYESPNTHHDGILNLQTTSPAFRSSTPKAKKLSINLVIAVPSMERSISELNFQSNSVALPSSVSKIISVQSSIDTVELEVPIIPSTSRSSTDSGVANNSKDQNEPNKDPVIEHQTNVNHNYVKVATLHQSTSNDRRVYFANEISRDNPIAHEDSGTSSSLAELLSTDAIPKTENRNGNSHSNAVLSPLNPKPRYRKTPRRSSGRFVLTKLPSMYVSKTSSISSLNKRVTLNVNMLMPSRKSGLMKKRAFLAKQSPLKNTSVSAGPSGTKKFINSTIVNVCEICNKSFDLKLKLMEHRTKHFENETNDCKYCGHKFQKRIALSTHLKENCLKIPVFERRKLLIAEFTKLSQEIL